MRLIDADPIYEGLKIDEELARDRVIDTPNSFPDGTLNPSAIRYMAQLSERTRFKELVHDAPTVDAVPVDMIKGRIKDLRKMFIDIDKDDVDEIWNLWAKIETLTKLLNMWAERKEE